MLVARLTVECHKFLKGLFLQTYYPWAFAYYARTQFSVPCRQNINLCQYRLSQITFLSITSFRVGRSEKACSVLRVTRQRIRETYVTFWIDTVPQLKPKLRGRPFNSWGGGGGGWFWKKISCKHLLEEKNCMQHKGKRKKILALLQARKKCCKAISSFLGGFTKSQQNCNHSG